MSVLTLAEVKTHLNITAETYDAELPAFIAAAESAVSRRVGPLEITSVTDRVSGCRRSLVLTTLPVVEVTAVTGSDGSTVDVSDLVSAAAGVVEAATGAAAFTSYAYTVEYDAGWGTVTEGVWDGPEDLRMAALELVRHLWMSQRGGGSRPGAPASTELSNTLPGSAWAMPFRVAQLIEPYLPLGGL